MIFLIASYCFESILASAAGTTSALWASGAAALLILVGVSCWCAACREAGRPRGPRQSLGEPIRVIW